MCTGRIDLSFIFRAFSQGADGVIIGGCWPGECHYVTEGNYDALANFHLSRKLLDRVGLRPERLRIEWVAASEGSRYAALMTEFTEQIKALGQIGKSEEIEPEALKLKLEAVNRLIPYMRLVEHERLKAPERTEVAINEFFESEQANRLFNDLIGDKLAVSQIMVMLGEGPLTSSEISAKLGMSSSEVAKHINMSSSQGLVRYDQERGNYALAAG